MRETTKNLLGTGVAAINPQCNFRQCVFILAHMRCGSTALSNILCSRADVSGYGEAHIRYDGQSALGRLVVNQARRGAWSPRARHLVDKILHSRHDARATPAFFESRAIFVAREPAPAIRSIRSLYARLGRNEYRSDAEVAGYYIERLETLFDLWARFPASRRVALTHAALMTHPDDALARISDRLGITPPLENRYLSVDASRRGGGGDPFTSGEHDRIIPRTAGSDASTQPVELDADTLGLAQSRYERFLSLTTA